MKGDWKGAKSLLSRIKSDFGKFLLVALRYSKARLMHKDKHMELLDQLQKEYPDARLEQVKFTQYFEHAERNGPPERATDLHSLFVGEKMCGTGVLWSEPDDFRKVFEMMAEDMRDADDRTWHGLPAPTIQSPTAYQSQAVEGHVAENPPSSESTQREPRDCPSTSPSSSSLPAIPRDPYIMTPGWRMIREYEWDRPALPSLSLDQQLILFQICLVHKSRYRKKQGNSDFWHRVADQFYEVSGWHWKCVRTLVQRMINSDKALSDLQLESLIGELRSHIHDVNHPIHSNVAHSNSPLPVVQGRVESIPAQGSAKQTFSHAGFDVEISSDDNLPTHYASRPRHNGLASGLASGPASSSVGIHTQPSATTESVTDLIAKSQEAKEQYDYDKAKSLLLQIPDKEILEALLRDLDISRETQIRANKELEKQSKEAELKSDWDMAKSKLSSIKGEDASFLLSALQFSQVRIEWAREEVEACDLIDQIIKDYPDPRLEQVRLDNALSDAEMTGNPQRIGHYRGLLRANQKRIGVLWRKPDDFRKEFQMMAAEMRVARDKAWYASPARAKPTGFQSNSHDDFGSGSTPGLEWERRPQSRSQRLDIDKELSLLDKARAELIKGYDKAKVILRQGLSEDCKEALKALERSASEALGDIDESECSLVAQADDDDDTYESQMAWVESTETESAANFALVNSLISQLPRNSPRIRHLRRQCQVERAQTIRYLARCINELNAGGNLRNVRGVE